MSDLADLADLQNRVAELERELGDLRDRRRIDDVYLHYVRGFDRNDPELLGRAFWPDAQINYDDQVNTLDEFVARHLDEHVRVHRAWGHLLTNLTVDIAGDVAHVEVYVTGLFMPRDSDPLIVAGRYLDRLDRRGGEWRIAVREFVAHFWSSSAPVEPELLGRVLGGRHREHAWDRHDVSYRRPLERR
jgi:hypothetical protein